MKYEVGTMIEIPRAALTADEIATEAEFFSFGTNDLTQMTFGFSRDDAGKFLSYYYDNKVYENDPFAHLDQKGGASWWKWLRSWAVPPVRTWAWASAASTAATPQASSSATTLGWTMSPALRSVCPLRVWLPRRLPSKTPANKLRKGFIS